MTGPVTVVGSYLSPYVRKVLACLHLKEIPYRIDPIIPYFGDDEFTRLSPLRRVPVLIDDRVALADSSAICQYLEDSHPWPPLYPRDVAQRAWARWLEEYADTRMGDVLIWGLYDQLVISPYVWGKQADAALVERIVQNDIPEMLDYLESQLPGAGFLFGEPGIADISIAVFFRNAAFARYRVDVQRWPRTAGFVDRVLGLDCLARLQQFETVMLRTPIADQREALAKAGAPLTERTFGTSTPRRGVPRS